MVDEMTFKFSKSSESRLATCHPDLQAICREVIKHYDFTVVCGHRNKAEQQKALKQGYSKLPWPKSRHNTHPSEAVDVAPYVKGKIPWDDTQEFRALNVHMTQAAKKLGIAIEWGGDWGTFRDLPHYQLKND
jgi:peptidoglycan L-alanyl-D-glutamate endopeptidase CwlK